MGEVVVMVDGVNKVTVILVVQVDLVAGAKTVTMIHLLLVELQTQQHLRHKETPQVVQLVVILAAVR